MFKSKDLLLVLLEEAMHRIILCMCSMSLFKFSVGKLFLFPFFWGVAVIQIFLFSSFFATTFVLCFRSATEEDFTVALCEVQGRCYVFHLCKGEV